MAFEQHPSAIVETQQIGGKTYIGAFTHILSGARIGIKCIIQDHVLIENDVVIGNRVIVKSGVQLWDGIEIENDVFIGPNVTFINDPFPRSNRPTSKPSRIRVRKGASIGANATILSEITIGMHAMVGAGALVTEDIPPYAIVSGNPARITGYDTSLQPSPPALHERQESQPNDTIVRGVKLYELTVVSDLRGKLSFAEYGKDLPFIPKRYFLVYDVPSKYIRGEHAHRKLHQFLVCVKGSIKVMADDGENRAEFSLNHPDLGLYIPPMVWASQYHYSQDAVLLAFASDIYDADDYIRDYNAFLQEVCE